MPNIVAGSQADIFNKVSSLFAPGIAHNNIWNPTFLGSSLTASQSAEITNGTFNDMYVGSYWTINGVNWIIMGFDLYYKCGNPSLETHHVVVIPETNLYSCAWNDTDDVITGGIDGGAGYVHSKIRANIKSSTNGESEGAELKFIAAFGDSHVLTHRAWYPSAYDADGTATANSWFDARVELMNEVQVFGCTAFTKSGWDIGIDKIQFPGFALNRQLLKPSGSFLLRSTHSSQHVCLVSSYGSASRTGASANRGVRPFALIA